MRKTKTPLHLINIRGVGGGGLFYTELDRLLPKTCSFFSIPEIVISESLLGIKWNCDLAFKIEILWVGLTVTHNLVQL